MTSFMFQDVALVDLTNAMPHTAYIMLPRMAAQPLANAGPMISDVALDSENHGTVCGQIAAHASLEEVPLDAGHSIVSCLDMLDQSPDYDTVG